jgi:hypothetical protein
MADSSYSKALTIMTLSDAEVNVLNQVLNDWESQSRFGQRIVRNIFREHFLHEDYMSTILRFILDNGQNIILWEGFEKEYQQLCYQYTLLGGEIQIPRPQYLGTAIEYDVFYKHLSDNYKLGKEDIKNFILSIQNANTRLTDVRKKIRLKKYGMWSTWSEHSAEPFDYAVTDRANEIRANMGLRREDARGNLLLFIYIVPPNIDLFRPTIADAGCSQYFEPPSNFEAHGWTVAWPDDGTMNRYRQNIRPRPECVHDSITFEDVKFPIIIRI